MGLYDQIDGIPRGYDNQVKLWGENMKTYKQGDKVPPVGIALSYSIQIRGGAPINTRFVHVVDSHLKATFETDPLSGFPVFDKHGVYVGHGDSHKSYDSSSKKPVENLVCTGVVTVKSPKKEKVQKKPPSRKWSFPLRKNLIVTIELPEDITNSEAERLSTMIKTLPVNPLE